MNAITRAKPKANSRNKGAAFERSIAQELELLTGVKFKRDIEQYRAGDHGDLIADDPAWPFTVECKRYAQGKRCKAAWWEQAKAAAKAAGKMPCVIYKYDRDEIRVALPFSLLGPGCSPDPDTWFETSLDGLAYLAREIMAETNSGEGRGESLRDRSSRRALAVPPLRQTEQQTEQSK